MPSDELQEKANFTRLSRLLVDKGTEALRNKFDFIHSPDDLPRVLAANKTSLQRLKPRVINDSQWKLMFPASGNPPDSKTFDVTLLTVLFRNICNFLPTTKWDETPPDEDRSTQANIARIKRYRNEVFAHVTSTRVNNSTFQSLWKKITQTLVELGVSQNDVDSLKKCPLGREEEMYAQKLTDWKQKEDECIQILATIMRIVEKNSEGINQLRDSLAKQSGIETPQCSMKRTLPIFEDTSPEKKLCRESDENILQKLAKHNFKSKIQRKLKLFLAGTREWLLKKVNDWFQSSDNSSKVLLITAGPGFGKSVFAAKVCEDFRKIERLAACHFCDFSNSNLRDVMVMLESLASQMCKSVPGFKEELLDQLKRPHQVKSLKDAFQIYLQNPLDELQIKEPRLVLIDGLDESAAENKNEIVNLIADYFPDLPEYVKILVTSRPEIFIASLSGAQKIDIGNSDDNNDSDLEMYLKACLPSLVQRGVYRRTSLDEFLNASLDESSDSSDKSSREASDGCLDVLRNQLKSVQNETISLISIVVKKCAGSFLYAYHFQSGLKNCYDLDEITNSDVMEFLPEGLNSMYQRYFKRLEDEIKAIRDENFELLKLLEMLAASKGPLPVIFVAQTFGLASDFHETKDIIKTINETVSCLLYVSDDMLTLFHNSVIDWLLAKRCKVHQYSVKVSDGNRSLWLLCEKVFEKIVEDVCSGREVSFTNDVKYALEHGLEHLEEYHMEGSVFWSVDVVILYYVLLVRPHPRGYLNLWDRILQSSVISEELQARISWHVIELSVLFNQSNIFFSTPQMSQLYLQAVLIHSPEGYFSEDEKKIAKSLLSKHAQFLEINSHEVSALPRAVWRSSDHYLYENITAVALSNNKKRVAVAIKENSIHVISLPTLVEITNYSSELEIISCCTFSPDDSLVLFGKLETAFNIAGRKEVPFFPGNEETFLSCAFSPNGKRLVTNDYSNTIKLWDVAKQKLLSSLCAEFSVEWCSFSITGLFIIAYSDRVNGSFGTGYSFCVWNAITFHRSDKRKLSNWKREQPGVLWRKECESCFPLGFEESNSRHVEINFISQTYWEKFIMSCSWICKGVPCSFSFKERYVSGVMERIPLTPLVAWNHLFLSCTLSIIKMATLEENLWLYADTEKLFVFRASTSIQGQSSLSHPMEVYSSSFSPDGSRLASCTSDGYINVWNVYTNQVEQRFKNNRGRTRFLCWWSENFLFVISEFKEIPRLTRYPVDDNFLFTLCQPVSLCHLVTPSDRLTFKLEFSQGFLSFNRGLNEPVKILDVRGVDGPIMIELPGIEPVRVEISPGGVFIFGCSDKNKVCIWKKNAKEPASYEVFYQHDAIGKLYHDFVCSFSSDSKFAVLFQWRRFRVVIDLDTGYSQRETFQLNLYPPVSKLFCIIRKNIFISVAEHVITFLDMHSLSVREVCILRYLNFDRPQETIKLSPKETMLAVPDIKGDMVFLRLSIPSNPLLRGVEREAVSK